MCDAITRGLQFGSGMTLTGLAAITGHMAYMSSKIPPQCAVFAATWQGNTLDVISKTFKGDFFAVSNCNTPMSWALQAGQLGCDIVGSFSNTHCFMQEISSTQAGSVAGVVAVISGLGALYFLSSALCPSKEKAD